MKHKYSLILTGLALALLGPMFYFRVPLYESSPDVFYVKAKLLQVLQGNIFTDPISGYATMHPPCFHLVLAPFKAVGIDLNTVLLMVTIFIVAATVFFTFKVIQAAFDTATAMWTCLALPFAFEFMGPRFILLATAFYFSIPFYLAGLWLYLKSETSNRLTIAAAALWGLAYLISPVYVFLIGLTLVYELVVRKNYHRFFVAAASFLVTITPFFAQAIYIYNQDLWGSSVFALWRGFPDIEWLKTFVLEYLAPTQRTLGTVAVAVHLAILITAGIMMIRGRKVFWYIIPAALAYLLTYYHFSGQYAMRMQLFLSVFIMASMIHGLRRIKTDRLLWQAAVIGVALFSLYQHYTVTVSVYERERETRTKYRKIGRNLWRNLDSYLTPGEYIFCVKDKYTQYVMAYMPVHSLGAHRTMKYFQLNSRIADRLERDYQTVMNTDSMAVIEEIAAHYGIKSAVASGVDLEKPLFKTLSENWRKVYQDRYFAIFKKPG